MEILGESIDEPARLRYDASGSAIADSVYVASREDFVDILDRMAGSLF